MVKNQKRGRISWKVCTVLQIMFSVAFSFFMHIPQYFQIPELACDMYGSCANHSSSNTNGKTGVNIPIDGEIMLLAYLIAIIIIKKKKLEYFLFANTYKAT